MAQFFAMAHNKDLPPFEFTVFDNTDVKGVEIRHGTLTAFLVCNDKEIKLWKLIAVLRMKERGIESDG